MRQWIVAALLAGAVGPALGQDLTGAKIERAVAEVIAPKLKELGHKAVALDPITFADTGKPAPAGAGLAQELANSLTRHGVGLTAKATGVPVLGGTLARVVDDKSDPPAPARKLVLTLSADDKPVAEVPLLLLSNGFTRSGPTDVTYPPKATEAERVAVLVRAIEDEQKPPMPPPEGEKVKWNCDKTVGVSLLAARRADVDKAREEKHGEGKVADLFAARDLDAKQRVKTADGELCRFRLVNNNPFDIACELRVAGLHWCEFADDAGKGKPALMVVVPANGEAVVRGWYMNDTTSQTFEVRKVHADAAAPQADVGVVSVAWHACWKKGDKPPAGDEDYKQADQQMVPGGIQKDKFERVERAIGKTRGMVKLEYGEFKE